MKYLKKSLIAGIIVLLACGGARAFIALPLPLLTQSQNEFATDLYSRLSPATQGNLFFSPYSIATALEMVFIGSHADTEKEIASSLHLNRLRMAEDTTPIRTLLFQSIAKHEFLDRIQEGGMEIHVANALWGKQGYAFDPTFLTNIQTYFSGNFTPVDFANESATREKINNWTENQTNGKIRNLIPVNALDPQSSRLVLTNAVYFKANWEKTFEKTSTQKAPFHVAQGQDVSAEMMHQTGNFDYAKVNNFRLLILPYKYNEASLIILLPDRMEGLRDLESALTADNIESWIGQTRLTPIDLAMPKFKETNALSLQKALSLTGIKRAFYPGMADFTGIANDPTDPLYISGVLHKAYIDLDENGTEAAAATAMTMVATAAIVNEQPPELFAVDHPFIYIIRANHTGDILFMGRMQDPTKQDE